ncbi:MAG: TIR domain-containing protein [Emcibacter sp.]|nr:TIR domain-containing protein [Emcibacter sp.]
MKRQCFYSFNYAPASWRISMVRNIGAVEGNRPATDNDWEAVTNGSDPAIERWIATQMKGRCCTVVLVGSNTADRKWINHEIVKFWDKGMGVVGIHIHGLINQDKKVSIRGKNPF